MLRGTGLLAVPILPGDLRLPYCPWLVTCHNPYPTRASLYPTACEIRRAPVVQQLARTARFYSTYQGLRAYSDALYRRLVLSTSSPIPVAPLPEQNKEEKTLDDPGSPSPGATALFSSCRPSPISYYFLVTLLHRRSHALHSSTGSY